MNIKCSDELIENYVFDELEKEKELEVTEHILQCRECFNKMKSLDECRVITENINKLKKLETIKKNLKIKENEGYIKSRKKWRLLYFPVFFRQYASYAIYLIFFSFLAFIVLHFTGIPRTESRGDKTEFGYFEPANGDTGKIPLTFRWDTIKNSHYYKLELFDETMKLIYESNKISDNFFKLPVDITIKLPKNKTYYWDITAFSESGLEIKTNQKTTAVFKLSE